MRFAPMDGYYVAAASPVLIRPYRKPLAGPLLGRIDSHIEVPRTSAKG
jgi:predicted ATPase with chaperone activity